MTFSFIPEGSMKFMLETKKSTSFEVLFLIIMNGLVSCQLSDARWRLAVGGWRLFVEPLTHC